MRITNVSWTGWETMNDKHFSTKEKILIAAIDLFAEKGYGNVSVREIAKKVGIKASSLYKHYESKEALLESIFAFFRQKMLEADFPNQDMRQYLQSVTPGEYLNQSFLLFKQVMWTSEAMKISKIINMEQQRNQSVRQFFMEELIIKPNHMLQHVLDLMVENGSIDDMDTRVLAEEYNSFILYLYFEQNFLKEGPSLDEIERKMKQHNDFYAHVVLKKKEGQ